jgi:hypothetical protein
MSITIAFKEKFYRLENVKENEDHTRSIGLQNLSLRELVDLYNEVVVELNALGSVFPSVSRFVDRPTGVLRVWKLLQEYDKREKPASTFVEQVKAPEAKKAKKEVFKKVRMRRFTLKPTEKVRSLKDPNTLRGRCAALLKAGGNFEDVKSLVRQFNDERNKPAPEIKVERRAYELVRIMHYYLNYGINHDIQTGLIKLYEKQ